MKWFGCTMAILLFISCRKPDDLSLRYSTVSIPVSGAIRDIESTPDGYVLVGGDIGKPGFVLQADQSLNNIQVIKSDFKYPIYCVAWTGGRYVFGTDEALIIYSDSLTDFTNHFFLRENWVNDQYKLPLRRIVLDEARWYVSGGDDFQFGLVFTSSDSAQTWKPTEFANEVHAITLLGKQEGIAAVGNGIVVTSSNGLEWGRQRLDNVLLTGATENYACSFQGDFYRVNDSYTNFDEVASSGDARFFTRLIAIDHPIYSHVAIGKQGNMAWISRGGSISGGVLDGDIDFLDAVLYNANQLLVATSEAKLYLVDIP